LALTDHVLVDSEITIKDNQARMNIGLPWFRNLPFSSILDISLVLDGTAITSSEIALCVDGKYWPIAELSQLTEQSWFLQDRAAIEFKAPASLGESADCTVNLLMLIPNMFMGPDKPLEIPSQVREQIPVIHL
jgi:hypothetical protein